MSDSDGIIEDPTHPRDDQPQDGPRPVDQGDPAECEKTIAKNGVEVEYLDTPVKSENDKKDYRVIKLPNGLTALLISDVRSLSSDETGDDGDEDDYDMCDDLSASDNANTNKKESELEGEKDERVTGDSTNGSIDSEQKNYPIEKMAGCGLCVGVGSLSDPDEIPGVADFLRHMVFMGSEKYPEENDFHVFLEEHGGSKRAAITCECTTFSFHIVESHLLPALDRFAQYFISPLLQRDAMSRQCEPMESDCQKLPTNVATLLVEQLMCAFTRPDHTAAEYTSDNLHILRVNNGNDKMYEELRKFRERHYSAHRMTLAIQAMLPLDTLEQYVKDCFAAVPNNSLPADDFSQFTRKQPFDELNFRRIHKLEVNEGLCEVRLTWMMPTLRHLYKCKPQKYVSWVLNHAGKGSLISYLRKKMWCWNCDTSKEQKPMYSLFNLKFTLTGDGRKHLKDVLDAAFSYITMMRKAGPQQRIHDEIHQIAMNDFKFQNTFPAAYNANFLAIDMQLYPPNDYITGSQLNPEYNATEIQACIDDLTPDSVSIAISDDIFNDAEFEKVEPWFNLKNGDVEIPEDWIEHWKGIEPFPEFHLPEPNIFITDDFSLVPLPEVVPDYPTKIHSDAMSEVWFRPDSKFRKPECYMGYHFMSPLTLASPQNSAALDLMVLVLENLLNEELNSARSARLDHELCSSANGIIVTLKGFNQKLPVSLAIIMRVMADCPKLISEGMFDTLKAQQRNTYYDQFEEPQDLERNVKWSILSLVHWGVVQKHAAISGLEFEQFLTFVTRFVDHIYLKCLVQGNITKEDGIRNALNCLEILKCRPVLPNTLPEHRAIQLPLGVRCCRVKNFDVNSVVTNYYQSDIGTIETSAVIELITMLMDESLFDQLVTQEQLGWNAYCETSFVDGINGFSITISTETVKYTMEYIDERIEAFLKSFSEILDRTSEEELSTAKIDVVKQNRSRDFTLKTECERNLNEFLHGDCTFDRESEKISAINSATLADLRDWFGKHVSGGASLRKLSIQIVGNARQGGGIENNSTEEMDIVEDTQESAETSEMCVDNNADQRDSSQEHTDNVEFPLEYLTDMPNEKTTKPSDYYITDIQRFKNGLQAFPAYSASTYRFF